MTELLQIPIFPVFLTLFAFCVGTALRKKTRSALFNPILVAAVIVLAFMFVTGMELRVYQAGNAYFTWLLTPATVSLAVSMYEQFQILRKNTAVIVAGVAAGAISCLGMVLVCCLLCRFTPEMTISMLPKSVTTAIGLSLCEMAGGIAPLTTAAIVITGIIASVMGPMLCRLMHITDEVAMGVAYGTAGHVVGTAKAMEHSELTGAASSLSLVVAGLLTAVVFPVLTSYL